MSPKIRLMVMAGTAFAASAATAQSLDQTREYAAEVMADAQQRTSLLGSSAAHHSQFGLTSADGSSTLNFSGWHQTRYTITALDDNGGAQDDFETGFSTPDTRLIFDGSVASPDTTYKIEIYINQNGSFGLMDAYLAHDFGNGNSGWVGQFTAPVNRETFQEDNQTQKIERSIQDAVFSAGQIQGAAFSHTDEGNTWRITGAFHDGANTADSPYNAANDGDWAVTARGDFAINGQVDDYFSTLRKVGTGHEDAMIVGGYFHIQQNADQPGSSDVTLIQAGADFLMDSGEGWNVYAAGNLRHTDADAAPDEFLDLGLIIQGGYFVSEGTEVFAAWDCVNPDDDRAGDADPFNTVAVGVNHFPFANSQAVKLSAQVNIFIDATTETGGLVSQNTNAGLLTDTEGGQVSVLGQAQVTF
ncbi:MAG: hypothetical protein ED559_01465 [Phycisphaera sp.]|nr:MAG: hypothetical protein ED559_01465 [Phycisphaera sp.]